MNSEVNENNSDLLKLLPMRLKAARRARGFDNRFTFAKFCDIPITSYRAHELGLRELKVSDLWKYAKALNISVTWLLIGKGHPLDHEENPNPDDIIFLSIL